MKSVSWIVAFAFTVASGSVQAMEDSTSAAPAVAASEAVRSGAILKTADGARLGRIERVLSGPDGKADRVSLIYDARFVYIPVSTLSVADKGLVTSLTKADVRKLR